MTPASFWFVRLKQSDRPKAPLPARPFGSVHGEFSIFRHDGWSKKDTAA